MKTPEVGDRVKLADGRFGQVVAVKDKRTSLLKVRLPSGQVIEVSAFFVEVINGP